MLVLLRWTGSEWMASSDHETWQAIPLGNMPANRAIAVAGGLFPGCLIAICGPEPQARAA